MISEFLHGVIAPDGRRPRNSTFRGREADSSSPSRTMQRPRSLCSDDRLLTHLVPASAADDIALLADRLTGPLTSMNGHEKPPVGSA